jgi:hypothetical protein
MPNGRVLASTLAVAARMADCASLRRAIDASGDAIAKMYAFIKMIGAR